MQAGQVYNFFLTATDSTDAGIKASAGVTVIVESSPISVSILGGDRVISQGTNVQVQVCGQPGYTVPAKYRPMSLLLIISECMLLCLFYVSID